MKQIYTSIQKAFKGSKVKHFALWNEDTTQLGKVVAFGLPAVFLEYMPVHWQQLGNGARKGDINIVLHIVSKRVSYTAVEGCDNHKSELDRLDFLDELTDLVTSIQRPNGGRAMLLETNLDHNPSELFHDTLTFVFGTAQQGTRHNAEQAITLGQIKAQKEYV